MFGKEKVIIKIGGMSCGHCVKHVEEALNSINGVKAKVSLDKNQAEITIKGDVSRQQLEKAIIDAGYTISE